MILFINENKFAFRSPQTNSRPIYIQKMELLSELIAGASYGFYDGNIITVLPREFIVEMGNTKVASKLHSLPFCRLILL